jgi:hypothetical protein
MLLEELRADEEMRSESRDFPDVNVGLLEERREIRK